MLIIALLASSDGIQAQDEEEKFVNLGLIGVSSKYNLTPDNRGILFRIRNNTTRTISNIFGWVYIYEKGEDDKEKNFVLLNNPHKGGSIVKGKPHSPGKISEWRFPLVRKATPPNQNVKYTLRVHSRSIFFANIEPILKTEEKPPNP